MVGTGLSEPRGGSTGSQVSCRTPRPGVLGKGTLGFDATADVQFSITCVTQENGEELLVKCLAESIALR